MTVWYSSLYFCYSLNLYLLNLVVPTPSKWSVLICISIASKILVLSSVCQWYFTAIIWYHKVVHFHTQNERLSLKISKMQDSLPLQSNPYNAYTYTILEIDEVYFWYTGISNEVYHNKILFIVMIYFIWCIARIHNADYSAFYIFTIHPIFLIESRFY